MSELHRMGIVHRHLAARNVMLDRWFQAKVNMNLGDFGSARLGVEYTVEVTNKDEKIKKLSYHGNGLLQTLLFIKCLTKLLTFGHLALPCGRYLPLE